MSKVVISHNRAIYSSRSERATVQKGIIINKDLKVELMGDQRKNTMIISR